MEERSRDRGVSTVENTVTAPGGSATQRVRTVLDPAHSGRLRPTYVIEGELLHFDNHGGSGVLNPGDAQWITAGRRVIHNKDAHPEKPLNTLQDLREDT